MGTQRAASTTARWETTATGRWIGGGWEVSARSRTRESREPQMGVSNSGGARVETPPSSLFREPAPWRPRYELHSGNRGCRYERGCMCARWCSMAGRCWGRSESVSRGRRTRSGRSGLRLSTTVRRKQMPFAVGVGLDSPVVQHGLVWPEPQRCSARSGGGPTCRIRRVPAGRYVGVAIMADGCSGKSFCSS